VADIEGGSTVLPPTSCARSEVPAYRCTAALPAPRSATYIMGESKLSNLPPDLPLVCRCATDLCVLATVSGCLSGCATVLSVLYTLPVNRCATVFSVLYTLPVNRCATVFSVLYTLPVDRCATVLSVLYTLPVNRCATSCLYYILYL
jgi:hypothetical protein